MADTKRISAWGDQAKDNDNYFGLDKIGGTSGKRKWSDIVSDMEADISLTNADVGLSNVTNHAQATSSEYNNHVVGLDDKHDANYITYNSSNVGAELATLSAKIDSVGSSITRVNIEFETASTAADEEYTEEEILALMGIDNTEYAQYNYIIDHRFPIWLEKLQKSSNYGNNVALKSDETQTSWQTSVSGRNHLDTLTIIKTPLDDSTDYRLTLDIVLYKDYIQSAL